MASATYWPSTMVGDAATAACAHRNESGMSIKRFMTNPPFLDGCLSEEYARTGLPVQCIIPPEPLCTFEISKDMDLKRLRTFIAVAELGTVSRAALDLRI